MHIKNLSQRRALKAARALTALAVSNSRTTKVTGPLAICQKYIAAEYGFQIPVILKHVEKYQGGQTFRLDGSDMGAGKTFIALCVCKILGLRPFIVCPKNVRKKWRKAAEYFGLEVIESTNYEKLTRGNTEWGKFAKWDLKMAEYAARKQAYAEACAKGQAEGIIEPRRPMRQPDDGDFDYEFNLPSDAFVIFDESHRMKGVESLNAEVLIAAVRHAAIQAKFKSMLLSASAACSPADMRASGYALGLHSLKDFMMWARSRGCVEGRWGTLDFVGGEHSLKMLHGEIFGEEKLGCRIAITDLPKGSFPETQIEAEAYDMGDDEKKIKAVYEEMEKELILADENAAMAKHPLTILLRARQRVELLKVPTFAEMIEDGMKDGMSVAVFLNFQETLFSLAKRLKTNQLYWGGNKRDREIALNAFQANTEKVLLLNIAAGAESIDMHDLSKGGKHSRLSIISPSWSALKMHQATGRVCRAGGTSSSIQRIVYCAGYPEQQVCEKVRGKMRNMALLNDGDLIPGNLQRFLSSSLLAEMESVER
jgi:superfamily II DNA or RNA helicase